MADTEALFRRIDNFEAFGRHNQKVGPTVDQIPTAQFAASTDEQIVEHVMPSLIINPLVLHEDRMTMTDQESTMQRPRASSFTPYGYEPTPVRSILVTISIPYTGDHELWFVTPNPSVMNFPRGQVLKPDHRGVGALVIHLERPLNAPPSEYQKEREERVQLIQRFITALNQNVEQNNQVMPNLIRGAITERRKRLDGQASIRKALNIPMERRNGAPSMEPLIAPRKIVRPLPSPLPARPEWGLRNEDYEHVLSVIRHEGISCESMPATFAKFKEPELRDIILAHLNGHYQGEATGERFRKHGKTDICIEFENRAAFIAECKMWRGEKECADTVDQLLSYVTWRDCRCAMVFFNKDVKGFTDVQQSAAECLKKHSLFVDDIGCALSGELRIRFKQKDDDKRIVTIHVFLFNLMTTPREKRTVKRVAVGSA